MRRPGDRHFGDEPRHDFEPCTFHSSDTWVIVDALITMMAAAVTILLVVLRHPFRLAALAAVVGTFGAGAGWWRP